MGIVRGTRYQIPAIANDHVRKTAEISILICRKAVIRCNDNKR